MTGFPLHENTQPRAGGRPPALNDVAKRVPGPRNATNRTVLTRPVSATSRRARSRSVPAYD